ncbi:MAG: type II/IV secretion system ATPase subunit, partial [Chloroflexi bacterium]|nr:type II/IV secretion system ATPase subunit [Chloroflexota bacterium]
MATITLPFKTSSEIDSNDVDIANDELYKSLPMSLQDVIKNNNHLLKYLHNIPIEEIGIPVYCPVLSRKMGDEKTPNFIYPTNSKEVFIHILFSKVDHRNSYIPIEPALTMNMDHFVRTLEVKLLGLGNKLATMSTNPDKKQQLLEYLEYVTVLKGNGGSTHLSTPNENTKIDKSLKLKLNKYELECLRYVFIRDKIGLGALEPLINDPYIEDISCSGLGQIFVEHKIFKSLKSAVTFNSIEELDDFVLWLGERIRKPVTFRNPIVDATLPDGSRINIVYGKDVSKRGSNFTIRKFSGVPTSIFELVEFGSINYQMLAYLSLVIGNGMNVFVSGETASGKTTLINALTTFIHPMAKIVSIEDTPELQVPHKNW